MNTMRLRIVTIVVITIIAIVAIALYINNFSGRSKAAVGPNGINMLFSPATAANLPINTNHTTTLTLTPVTPTYKISGIDLRFTASGNLQIVDISAPVGLPVQLTKSISAQSARVAFASTAADAQQPSIVQLQITYKSGAAGGGTIQVNTSGSSVTGTLSSAVFELDTASPPIGQFTFVAPTPTPTLTPIPPTPTKTPPDAPIVTKPACIDGDYTGSGITFTWTNNSVTSLQISGDKDFAYYPSSKSVTAGSLTTTGPAGFQFFGAPLAIKPDAPYFVRTFNGTNSVASTFTIPKCVTPTPTSTPTPTVTQTPSPTPIPALSLNVSPEYINSGGTSTLTWSSLNMTTCTATGAWSGTKATSGSQSVGPLSVTTVFGLSCTGPGGTLSHTRNVFVNPTPTPTKTPTPTFTPTPTPCPTRGQGDANCDGQTNLADFEFWRREFQQLVTTKNADFNGNGTVDLADFEIWRSVVFAE